LAWTGDDVNVPARFAEAAREFCRVRSGEGHYYSVC
jgi:hypothetical protein